MFKPKGAARIIHQVLVGVLICLFTIDSASACRLFGGRRRKCCRCVPPPTCGCDGAVATDAIDSAADSPPASSVAPPSMPVPPAPSLPPEPPAARPAPKPAAPPAPKPVDPPAPAPLQALPAPPKPAAPAPPKPAEPMPPPATSAPASPAPAARPAPAAPAAPPPAPPAAPKPTPDSDDPFAPAKPAATPAPAKPEDDDPFAPVKAKPAAIVNETPMPRPPLAAELQLDEQGRLPMRLWTDDSGFFQVRGRLVLILEGKVRLLKETGRTTTVPLERLSPADRAYIERVIGHYGQDLSRPARVAAR